MAIASVIHCLRYEIDFTYFASIVACFMFKRAQGTISFKKGN